MSDQEDQVVNSLLRNGLASDRPTSRRIVQEVMRVVLGEGDDERVAIHPNDLHSMDELVDEISHLVWEIEAITSDHKTYLLDIIGKSQHVIRIAKRYITPGDKHRDQV